MGPRTATASIDEESTGAPRPAGRGPLGFLLRFGLIYAVLHAGYFLTPDALLRDVVHFHGIVQPAASILRAVVPGTEVEAVAGTLRSPDAVVNIVRGCDGAGVLFLMIAAIASAGAPAVSTVRGVLLGAVLVYAMNEARVVSLYLVAAYRESWFDFLHDYFIPGLLILACAAFFHAWLASTRPPLSRSTQVGP
jgi:exosortase family protein XrtM